MRKRRNKRIIKLQEIISNKNRHQKNQKKRLKNDKFRQFKKKLNNTIEEKKILIKIQM